MCKEWVPAHLFWWRPSSKTLLAPPIFSLDFLLDDIKERLRNCFQDWRTFQISGNMDTQTDEVLIIQSQEPQKEALPSLISRSFYLRKGQGSLPYLTVCCHGNIVLLHRFGSQKASLPDDKQSYESCVDSCRNMMPEFC